MVDHDHANPSRSILETLETRVLLATVDPSDFGAKPNDGRDDTSAIRAAINAARSGDTVKFDGGTYHVDGQIDLKDGITLDGQDRNAKLVWTGGDTSMLRVDDDNVTIKDFKLEGSIKIERANDVEILDNRIENPRGGWSTGNGVYLPDRNNDVLIRGNHIVGAKHRGVYFMNQNRMKVENNIFEDCYQAVSGTFFGTNEGSSVSWNTVTGWKGFGIELQNGRGANSKGLKVEGNLMHSPNHQASDRGEIFLSLAMGTTDDRKSSGMVVRKNVMVADGNIPDKLRNEWRIHQYKVLAFELMGSDFVVEDNTCIGFGWYQLVGNNGGTWKSRDNKFVGTNQLPVVEGRTTKIGAEWISMSGFRANPSEMDNDMDRMGSIDDIDLDDLPDAGHRHGPSGSDDPDPEPQPNPEPNPEPEPQPSPSGDFEWLSALTWESSKNGWGSAEKNRSNGERGSSDGRTIRIDGESYERGLGVHAGSEIVYDLNEEYEKFTATIGVDDEVGNSGSVVFQVFADGEKIYDSGVMKGSSDAKEISVDIEDVDKLKLVVTDAGDGKSYDHASWADAKLFDA